MRVEFLGNGSKEEVESRLQKVASAGRLSRTSGKAYEVFSKSGEYDQSAYIKAILKANDNGDNPKDIDPNKYTPYEKNL